MKTAQIIDFPGLADGYAVACAAFAEGIRPPPDINIWQWADRERWLPPEGSSEYGHWHTSRVPYGREIMECLSPQHPARRVVFMASRQVSKTEIGLNFIGHHVRYGRGAIMCTQPTMTPLAERFSKTRLTPMIEHTPTLLDRIGPTKSRASENTLFLKSFPGGMVVISGANSAASLRQLPFGKLFADEVDEYERDIEGQGDVLDILEGAMTTFPFRKIYLCSTPTIESLSRINREYQKSDQRQYHVPCPHCEGLQPLVWEQLHWPDHEPREARYVCIHCGALIEHWQKDDMLKEAGYGGLARWIPAHPEREIPGFHANGLYAPLGLGLTWGELAEMYEAAKDDPVKLKTFKNVRLGITSEDPNEKLDHEELMSRAGNFAIRRPPAGCLFLTAGVDVQKDRFAVLILGHGRRLAVWFLDYLEIEADPTQPEDWLKLEAHLAEPLHNAHGMALPIRAYAVDAGYLTDDVLNYTRARRGRCIAVKGASVPGKPVIASKPGKTEFRWPKTSTISYGAEIWTVGSDTAKDRLFARLQKDRDKDPSERMVHFPGFPVGEDGRVRDGLDENFFLMLTAEVHDTPRNRWVKVRPRNEALDCYNYAMAAAMQPKFRVHHWSEAKWAELQAQYEPPLDLFADLDPIPTLPIPRQPGIPDAPQIPESPAIPAHPITPSGPDIPAGRLAGSPRFRR